MGVTLYCTLTILWALQRWQNNNKHFLFISALGQNSLSWAAYKSSGLSCLNAVGNMHRFQEWTGKTAQIITPFATSWIDIQKTVPSRNIAATACMTNFSHTTPRSISENVPSQIAISGPLIQQHRKYKNCVPSNHTESSSVQLTPIWREGSGMFLHWFTTPPKLSNPFPISCSPAEKGLPRSCFCSGLSHG